MQLQGLLQFLQLHVGRTQSFLHSLYKSLVQKLSLSTLLEMFVLFSPPKLFVLCLKLSQIIQANVAESGIFKSM